MGNKLVIKLNRNIHVSSYLHKIGRWQPVSDVSLFDMYSNDPDHPYGEKNFQPLTLRLVISQFLQDLKLTNHQCAQVSQGNHEFIKRNFSSACWFVLSSVWLFLLLPQQHVDSEIWQRTCGVAKILLYEVRNQKS